jgi:CBS domain containing-hemolysin-like protein
VSEVNDELEVNLPQDGDYETIGGLIAEILGRIPGSGERFERDGVRFHVLDAGPRKVNRVRIEALREAVPARTENGE